MARRSRTIPEAASIDEPAAQPAPTLFEASEPAAATPPKTRRPRATAPKATASTEAVEESIEATPTVRRRRRRRTVDQAAQGALLIAALLKTRGARGATQGELQTVSEWARGVNAETAEMAQLAKRVRIRKGEATVERQASAQLNQLLLDGVLAGKYSVDVNESGSLVFGGEVSGG